MKSIYCTLILAFIITSFSCKKKDNLDAGPVNTQPQISIDSIKLSGVNSIVVYSTIKNYSSTTTFEKGLCWDTATNPTILRNKKLNPGSSVTFTDSITNLLLSETYHIKSFFTAGSGVIYSSEATVNTKTFTTVFDKMYIGDDTPTIMGVVGDEDDGFVVCSHVSPQFGNTYRWLRLTKLDNKGNVVWTKDHNDGTWKEPYLIRQLSDGYLIGLHYYQYGDIRVLLQKFDLNGNFVWEREFQKDALQFFVRLVERNDNFLLTMKTLNGASVGDPNYKISLWDFIVSKNGMVINEKQYPDFNRLSSTSSVHHAIETPDDGYIGYCDSVYNIGCCGGNTNIEVERFGPQNNMIWKKTYGGPEFEVVVKGVPTTDGNYLISGIHYIKPHQAQARLLKLDFTNGKIIWEKFYGRDINGASTNVGDLILHSKDYYLTGNTFAALGYIVKFDEFGNQNWEYFIPVQNGYRPDPQAIYISPKKNIYVFGSRNNDPSKPAHLWMMKLVE